jgi:hypothetical protein
MHITQSYCLKKLRVMGKKFLFWTGLSGLLIVELFSVYLIMPFPGSQEIQSLDLAYFLYRWRWIFRIFFIGLLVYGSLDSLWQRKWIPYAAIVFVTACILMLQFKMSADRMFLQPRNLNMAAAPQNNVDPARLVIGVEKDGEARAYPIQYLAYHHQVLDSLAGKPIMVTYCNVCRTGRVFEPFVDGHYETFRLVGMDRYNAMFEDATTGSWWRQATGEAVQGPLRGRQLPEIFSIQTSLRAWMTLHPQSLVMQADEAFNQRYDSTTHYETGRSRKKLTGTDSLSWRRKSWVVGLVHRGQERAYDWNQLLEKRILPDTLGGMPVFLVVSADSASFFAFEQPVGTTTLSIRSDTIEINGRRYRLDGKGLDTNAVLNRVRAYQEFWHSWETFHPLGSRH